MPANEKTKRRPWPPSGTSPAENTRRRRQNQRLVEHFEEATRAVKSALAGPIKLKDEIVVGVGAATGWYWVRHGDEERYGMAADEAINTIVQILILYD